MVKFFTLISFLIGILFISGCISNFYPYDKAFYYGQVTDKAVSENDASICMQIDDQGKRDECIGFVAIETNNFSLCNGLSSKMSHDLRYISGFEGGLINASIEDACFFEVFVITENWKLCEKIKDLSLKDSCYLNIAGRKTNISICEMIKSFSIRDGCYFDIARLTNDTDICYKISIDDSENLGKRTKKNCLSYFGK